MQIRYELTKNKKEKPDMTKLGFGNYYTDHMFMMDYYEGQGFCDPRIIPYGPIEFDPASLVLHYAQETFEGLKAYRHNDDILLFRPEKNALRFQKSNERLGMPKVPISDFIEAIEALVNVDEDWIPNLPNTALYLRPFMFAFEPKLGVHPAKHYKFLVIASPVGSYYQTGLKPVKIFVEEELVRAVKGGTGFAKCGGNYASSILAQMQAEEKGYNQVLWLDGINHRYVEEVGTMNVMFVIGNEVITPEINGSILEGITRDSCIQILKRNNIKVTEKRIDIKEIKEALENKTLTEAFGTGTAAVISPIGVLGFKDKVYPINNNEIGPIAQLLYDTITKIQRGEIRDTYGFTKIAKKISY